MISELLVALKPLIECDLSTFVDDAVQAKPHHNEKDKTDCNRDPEWDLLPVINRDFCSIPMKSYLTIIIVHDN